MVHTHNVVQMIQILSRVLQNKGEHCERTKGNQRGRKIDIKTIEW